MRRFRPLTGIMVLILRIRQRNRHVQRRVSVPLRGLWFLSRGSEDYIHCYAGYVSVPLRGLWFLSEYTMTMINHAYLIVSVPLRGLWFLSEDKERVISPHNACFRPLTGIMVLIWQKGVYHENNYVSVPLRGLWFLSKRA